MCRVSQRRNHGQCVAFSGRRGEDLSYLMYQKTKSSRAKGMFSFVSSDAS